ncbi:unnamed protein product [Porites lobata]|uniref:Uncharacterized protein n=1 Tax=Porites lobata TaxID=104759 RepID=A0ABN8QWY4_9CNID|nr:unnamed protein product [Porites lobata]
MDLPLCIYPRSIIILTLRGVFCCRAIVISIYETTRDKQPWR